MDSALSQLHPALSTVPVVLVVVALLGRCLALLRGDSSWLQFSNRALLLALFVAPFTYFTGYLTGSFLRDSTENVLDRIADHQAAAWIFVLSLFLTAVFGFIAGIATRAGTLLRWLSFVALVAAAALGLRAARLGGELVFQHGVGVAPVAEKGPIER